MDSKNEKRDFWNAKDKLVLVKVAVFGFLFILLSKAIAQIPDMNDFSNAMRWFFELLCKELGIAAMIASFLGVSVEGFSRAKQHQELADFKRQVSENVLSAVFRKIVPEKIYQEIKSTVLEQTLIKRDSHLTYDLQSLPKEVIEKLGLAAEEAANIVFCNITTRHTMVNLSENDDNSYIVKCGISCDLDSVFEDYLEIHSVDIGGVKLTPEELKKHTKIIKEKSVVELKYPRPLKGKESLTVIVCSRTIKRMEDTEVWTTLVPAENMTLEVIHEGQLCIGAKSNHSKDIKAIPLNERIPRAVFELHYGIFPHQGITFWWRKAKVADKANSAS